MNEKFLSNKYQVKREIACGGMGTIYLATDTKLGRDVAIKMLHPQYSGEPAFAQRFLREAWAMAKLDHSNIIRIWSVEEEENSHCIVMEYFPGEDLKHIVRSRGPLPLGEALSLVTQIIQGLAYAHYMGIIHRDIKPANILVDQEGKVKITDFGIAAAFSESSLTVDGTVMGTPEYMAPEQARAEAVGPHTDLYSAGILLYELVTGQTPYKGIPAQTLVAKLAFGTENPSLTFPSTIPIEIQDLIRKMTQQRVENRLTDINEILSVLKTDFPLCREQWPDDDKTEVYAPSDPSEGKVSHSEKTLNKVQPILPQDKTTNRLHIPSNLPPLHEDTLSRNKKSSFISPHTRTLLMTAIGVLAFVSIFVLILSQWPTNNPTQSPEDILLPPPVHQNEVETTINLIQTISKDRLTTQGKLKRDFESFNLNIHSLRNEITNKKLPSNQSDIQQWLNEKRNAVNTLVQKYQELEDSQKSLLDKGLEGFTVALQQGEQLLQQDLSLDQQKQLQEAKTNLEQAQHSLATTSASQLRTTKNLISKLEIELKNSEQSIIAREKPPKGNEFSKDSPQTTTQLAELQEAVHALDKGIGEMAKTMEAATGNFTSQLFKVKTEISQIDISSLEKNKSILVKLKDNLHTIQQQAQSLFNEQLSQVTTLKKSLLTTTQNQQDISKIRLNSSQKSQLEKVDQLITYSQNRLEAFPPDSWKQLQILLLEIQALMSTTEKTIAQYTKDKRTKEEQLADLAQKTTQLASTIQTFQSHNKSQNRKLTQQAAESASQLTAFSSKTTTRDGEKALAAIQKALEHLNESITQDSRTHDEQSQIFARNQTEILTDLNKYTGEALTPPLKKQAAEILHTLKSNQKELENLKKINWKELADNVANSLQTLHQVNVSLKKQQPPTPPNVQKEKTEDILNTMLTNFTTAFENQDLLHLQLTTSMSESRTRNLELMFKSYKTIEAHTTIISTSGTQAIAKVFIDKLINQEGKSITPNFIVQETTLTIPKNDGKWGKIQW